MKKYSIELPIKPVNKIAGLRTYLCGAMDRVPDGGVGWRRKVGQYLMSRGVIVFDPSNKPIDIGIEDIESREERKEWKENGDYDKIADTMRLIRNTDLRMVDISDFIVVNLDLDIHPCGTYEELFLANRQKKPIMLRVEQGKRETPDWLLGTIPHETIFSTWDEVRDYLDLVDAGRVKDKRWMFFDI